MYTAYADDTTFFSKYEESVKKVMNVFDTFSIYSGLKPNKSKCEIAGIGVLKGVSMELCGMECIDLTKNSKKILVIHFSYNKKIENEENFIKLIKKIENVLKIWRTRSLTVQGKIAILKTLAISKDIHPAVVTNVPHAIIDQLNKIQKDFIWNRKHPKIRHSTFCNTFENGGLKSVDIPNKLTSLQCSWIKRLYDTTTHCWKVIPTFLIKKRLEKNFIFHSNLSINPNKIKEFPTYYQDIFIKWEKHFSSYPSLSSSVASQCLWHNKIDDKTIFSSSLSAKGVDFVGQLFQNNQLIKKWDELKTEFDLIENQKFPIVQITHDRPSSWKEVLRNYTESINNLVIQDHHLIKRHQIFSLNKLSSATLYEILIDANKIKPTSQTYFQNLFPNFRPDLKSIYLIPRRVTLDTNLRIFQYKLLNNVLYLNNMLFRFRKVDSPLCLYCNEEEETPLHLFHSCLKTKQLWNKLRQYFSQFINIQPSTPQSSIVGIFHNNQHSVIINHLLLIFKFYIYGARNTKQLTFGNLKIVIKKIKELEKELTSSNKLKLLKKWRSIDHIID